MSVARREPATHVFVVVAHILHLETRLEALSEWVMVREAIDRHKEAIRIARRTDDRLTACVDGFTSTHRRRRRRTPFSTDSKPIRC